jgi:hypothetical protein
MNGDEIRATRFLRCRWANDSGTPDFGAFFGRALADPAWGYNAAEVDDLLRSVAEELDAGRPAGPLIEKATFQRELRSPRYDIDAVDWFLGQFLLPPDPAEPAGINADAWRDLAVAQLTQGGGGDPALPSAMQASEFRTYFTQECGNAWRSFSQQPGTSLRWGKAEGGLFRSTRYELHTAEQQTIASRVEQHPTVEAGGKNFTWRKIPVLGSSTAGSWPLSIAELATRSWRDVAGNFAAETMSDRAHRKRARAVGELIDETGIPILYASGTCYHRRATVRVTFPDQRWLRLLVRGTDLSNAIMTAVDQAGNRVVRYRKRTEGWGSVEITVNPHWKLTYELMLVIVISAGYLKSYFDSPGG